MQHVDFSDLEVGNLITYHLRLDQRSTNPLRMYHAIVSAVYPDLRVVQATMLDDGYEQLQELVKYEQIVEISNT